MEVMGSFLEVSVRMILYIIFVYENVRSYFLVSWVEK